MCQLPEWSVLLHFPYTMEVGEGGDWDGDRSRRSSFFLFSFAFPTFPSNFNLYPCQEWKSKCCWNKWDIILFVQPRWWWWCKLSSWELAKCLLSYHRSAHVQLWSKEEHLKPTFDAGALDEQFSLHQKMFLTKLFCPRKEISKTSPPASEISDWTEVRFLSSWRTTEDWSFSCRMETRCSGCQILPSRPVPNSSSSSC